MLARLSIACLLAALSPTAALRLSAPGTRRSAIASLCGGAAVAVLPMQSARAETCLGKCVDPEAERRKAERLAIQTGSANQSNEKFADGVEGLIQKSIRNAEAANNGVPLSEEEKATIAAKVRSMSPDSVVVRTTWSRMQRSPHRSSDEHTHTGIAPHVH